MTTTLKNAYDLVCTVSTDEEKADEYYYDMLYYISTYILEERLKRNMSQTEFGELLEISQPMVSKLESGDYNFTLKQLCDLSTKLNIKPNFLFAETASSETVYKLNLSESELEQSSIKIQDEQEDDMIA